MRNIAARLGRLSVRQPQTPGFYKNEARQLLRRYDTTDPNFRFLLAELAQEASRFLDARALEEIARALRPRTAERGADPDESPRFLRNKVKTSKKDYKYQ